MQYEALPKPHGASDTPANIPATAEDQEGMPRVSATEQIIVSSPKQNADPRSKHRANGAIILEGRLHPATLAFAIYHSIRRLIIPVIPLFFFGNRIVTAVLLSLLIGASVVRAVVRYLTFSYRIEAGELITRQGILERTERHIPLERVQEIRIEQGVLHRLFGVVDASVETASGQGVEAQLSVLSRREAERLRQAVSNKALVQDAEGRSNLAADASAAERKRLHRLHLRDLVLAGLTSNHLVSAFVLMGTLWALVDDILPRDYYERTARAAHDQASSILAQGTQTALIVAGSGLLLLFLVSLLFSVIGSIVLFYGFTLSQSGENLHRSYGLLTRRVSSLPRRRIQVLEIKEGMLRRLLHLAALRADTAGNAAADQEEKKEGRDVLLPIVPRRELDALLPVIFTDLEPGPIVWTRVSKLAVVRDTIQGGLVCMIATGGMYWYNHDLFGLWPLILLPLVCGVSVLRYYNLGYMFRERYLYTRRGWLSRSTHIVPVRNAQTVTLRQSPVSRRLGLATLIVDTAGQSYTGGGPMISNLPLEEAQSLASTLAHRAAAMHYQW
ncbi:MAG: PH domain-containing protein [Pyrinomonadaceae bacterium]|nr:PH domain-containing protein [Pyrinomonadaceae bacterium]